MKSRTLAAAVAIAIALTPAFAAAQGVQLKVLASNAVQDLLTELAPQFERISGNKLTISYGTAGAVAKRFVEGETADVVITSQPSIDSFVQNGKARAANVAVIARSSVGVAVKKGAARPDISSTDALKRTLLAARSITYSNPAGGGTSGLHFAKVLDTLGIAEEMKGRTIFVQSGPVATLVANGQAEIAVQQMPELVQIEGIEVIGPLPGSFNLTNVISAATTTTTEHAAASSALIDFLRSPQAAQAIKARGMESALR